MKGKASRVLVSFIVVLWFALMSSGCSTRANQGASADSDPSIPDIAKLAGAAVGYSTQEDLAGRWGEGKVIIGGHPNSGRLWRIQGTAWVLSTDGFLYSDRGLVVDSLQLRVEPERAADAPVARSSKDDFLWLGGVQLGMTRNAAEQFLKSKSLSAAEANQELIVRAVGHHALVNSTLGDWVVKLSFKTNVLTQLSIEACERASQQQR